jgi:hypothetical protein
MNKGRGREKSRCGKAREDTRMRPSAEGGDHQNTEKRIYYYSMLISLWVIGYWL